MVLRNSLKSSTNQEIKDLWKCTSSNINVQYDTYQNSKSVLKAFRASHEERLQSHLISEGSFFSFIIYQSLLCLNSVRSSVQSKMPKNIFNFTVRYIHNTLPTQSNLTKLGISSSSDCSFCLTPKTFLHIVAGCKSYLDQGRFIWRHDSVLKFIAKSLTAVNGKIYSDLPEYLNPSIITGDKFRPDFPFIFPSNHLYILELTISYESNLSTNSLRKKTIYKELVSELQNRYDKVHFVNFSMGALGTMGSSSSSFPNKLARL